MSQTTTFTILPAATIASGRYAEIGGGLQLGPSGATFAAPLALMLPYDPAKLAAAGKTATDLVVLHKDDSTGVITVLTPQGVDTAQNTVTVQLSSFCVLQPAIRAPVDPNLSTATVSPGSLAADGAARSTITVTLKNSRGEGIPGVQVTLAASGSANTLVQPVGTTDAQGVTTGTIASTSAEATTISVSADQPAVLLAQQPVVTFVAAGGANPPPPSATKLAFVLEPIDGAAGCPFRVRVAAQTAGGQTVAGYTAPITLSVAEGPGDAVLYGRTAVTPANGVADFDCVFTNQAGLYRLWARSGGLTAVTSAPFALGSVGTIQADVSGDGVPDRVTVAHRANLGVIADAGAIYVWRGGAALTGSKTPDATLTVPGAVGRDFLGLVASTQGLLVADVTGDGVLDVVAGAYQADVGGVVDTGAIYVWKGGATLIGSKAPDATLTVPGAVASDELCHVSTAQGLLVADVSGDGVLDLVAGAFHADVGGVADTGAIYVWRGGVTLTGSKAPDATLTVPGAVAGDQLGHIGAGQGVLVADVSGDGVLDLVAGAYQADVGGVVNAGAIYVWNGGATLTGNKPPDATLTVPGAMASDFLCALGAGQGLQVADVTGDGVLDLVAGASQADVGGVANTGAIHVWRGGATLTGSKAPDASLTVPGAVAGDNLGSFASGSGLLVAEVTGDGVLDLVAGAYQADVGGVVDAGAIYVWRGGAPLTGSKAPDATLTVPGAVAIDQLGYLGAGQGLLIADVTSDGVLDLVAGAYRADLGGVVNTGAIYVWKGGATLAGSKAPDATLTVPGAIASDQLGYLGAGQGLLLADVTGDGVSDLVAGSALADVGGVADTGAIYLWRGGVTLTGSKAPDATLTVPGAVASDFLGFIGVGRGQGLLTADVTGDGVLDFVAGAIRADGGALDAGAVHVWRGGPTLAGNKAPDATLTVPGAVANDFLCAVPTGQGLLTVDVTGDGVLDLVVGAYQADVGGVLNTGALYMWRGGGTLTGNKAPDATLTVPGAAMGDSLGDVVSGQGLLVADVTSDGIPDLVAGAAGADVGGVGDAGAIYVWKGGATLTGDKAPDATLTVPGAANLDQLGQ
ncbi:MAG: Ig-like domain-containing protein [Planctomycetota bacterium]